MNDADLLNLVADERKRAIGFDNASELIEQRELALNYAKGEMPDVPSLPNRSKAVSMDVADAVETLLPDLVEIFTGGDDVATFVPRGQEDEEAAQQETDYINYVMFQENNGWLTLYTMFKDALLTKTGVVKFGWEPGFESEERLERKSAVAYQMAAKDGEIEDAELAEPEEGDEEPLYNFTVCKKAKGRIKVWAVPPEDFAVANDTVILSEATYCAMRSRPRAQDLILQGIDEAEVNKLSPYGADSTGVAVARDTAGENSLPGSGSDGLLRRVEVVEHFIRVLDGKDMKLWRVLTGEGERVLLEKEEIDRVPFAAITPYIVTHRFYGESVADKLLEIQRINTALTRIALDSAYFAINQRHEVSEADANANTIPDMLRHVPGSPIRSKTGNAVRAIPSGTLGFDVFGALEYFKTQAEERTGIVRAAQGLNPDTLHDTAKGALAMLTQSQKRVRLIARIFAETGIKDLFLGVHAMIRKHSDGKTVVRIRNKWTDIDPTSWGERADMQIEVGVGAAGKEAQIALLAQKGALMNEIVMMQGGPTGPIVTVENVYNFAKSSFEKMGEKAPEKFLSDPKDAPKPEGPPPPDPAVVEAQAKAEFEREKAAAELRQKQENAANDYELQAAKLQAQTTADQQRLEAEMAFKREVANEELTLKREQLAAELMLKREQLAAELELKRQDIAAGHIVNVAANIGSDVQVGGEPG